MVVDLSGNLPVGNNFDDARYGGGNDSAVMNRDAGLNSSFENIVGTAFADELIGDGGINRIYGGGGTDIIRAGVRTTCSVAEMIMITSMVKMVLTP